MLTSRCVLQLLAACSELEELAMEVTWSDAQHWAMYIDEITVDDEWPLGRRGPPLRRLELVTRGQINLQTLWCARF